jgi:hypothetical protein
VKGDVCRPTLDNNHISLDNISLVVFPLHTGRVVISNGFCTIASVDISLIAAVNLLNASDISFHMSA